MNNDKWENHIRNLAIRKDPKAFEKILQLFKSQNRVHQLVAIEALGDLEDPKALEFLQQIKKETQNKIKEYLQNGKKIPEELEDFYDSINNSIKKISQKVLDNLF